jgi:alkylated DNA repair dioxygenase AlkB
VSAILEPRSLLILSSEARYEWTHEIPARKSDEVNGVKQPRARRISLTFRTLTPA